MRVSKVEAKRAMSRVGEIENLIVSAEQQTTDANAALKGAEDDARDAEDTARRAQVTAEEASREAQQVTNVYGYYMKRFISCLRFSRNIYL